MLDKYVKNIDRIKQEILFIEDRDKEFIIAKDFMRFQFKTDDNLVYNQKINIPVCVISISGLLKEKIGIIHRLNYKIVFMKVIICVIKTTFKKKLNLSRGEIFVKVHQKRLHQKRHHQLCKVWFISGLLLCF